jgi:hypothetical protein
MTVSKVLFEKGGRKEENGMMAIALLLSLRHSA